MDKVSSSYIILGAGIVGRTLAAHLRDQGHSVTLVSRSATPLDGVRTVSSDLTNRDEVRRVIADSPLVFQCANAPYEHWDTLLKPLYVTMAQAARDSGARMVAIDNLYMYDSTCVISEATTEVATTPRTRLRKQVMDECRDLLGDALTLVRASDFYGPGVTNAYLSARVLVPAMQGRVLDWIGNPDRLHSFAYVPDVARALADVGQRGNQGRSVWVLPHAPAQTPRQMLSMVAQKAGKPLKIRAVSAGMLPVLGLFMPALRPLRDTSYQFANDFVADGTAFQNAFGWSATPLARGLEATVASL